MEEGILDPPCRLGRLRTTLLKGYFVEFEFELSLGNGSNGGPEGIIQLALAIQGTMDQLSPNRFIRGHGHGEWDVGDMSIIDHLASYLNIGDHPGLREPLDGSSRMALGGSKL